MRVQVYSKVCLWLRGQEIHLGGNWNIGLLKGGDQYSFFYLFFLVGATKWLSPVYLCLCEDAWSSLVYLMDEKQKYTRGVWHTLSGSFQRKDLTRLSTLTQTQWPVFPWMRIAERRERERRRMRQRGVRGELMRERLLLDLITVKHWTLIGDIKTFYESSCSNLQHYNSVPVQNKSAAAL